jgi:hypothetical protein
VGALRTGWAFIKRVTADARETADEVHVKSTAVAVVVEEPVESDVDGEAVNGEQVHQPLSAIELVACDVEGVVVTQHHQEEGEDEVAAVMQEAPLPVERQDDALTSAAAAAILADEPAQHDAVAAAAAAAEVAEPAPAALVPTTAATPVSISMSAVRRAAREAVSARERLLMSSSSAAAAAAVYEDTTPAAASEEHGVHASMQEPLALLRAAEEAAAAATVVYMAALADAPMELLPSVSSASETLSAATPLLEEGPQEVAESFIEEPIVADTMIVIQPSVAEPVVEAPQPQPVALPPIALQETPQPSSRGLSRHAAAAAARAQHKAKRRAASAQAGRPVTWRKEGGVGLDDGDASRALRWLAKLDGDGGSPGAAVLSDGYDGAVSEYASGTEGSVAVQT